jgi:hypothetical protein
MILSPRRPGPVSKHKLINKECNATKYCYYLGFQKTVISIQFTWRKLCSSFHFLASSVFLILPSMNHQSFLQTDAVPSGSPLIIWGLTKSNDRSPPMQIMFNPQLFTRCVYSTELSDQKWIFPLPQSIVSNHHCVWLVIWSCQTVKCNSLPINQMRRDSRCCSAWLLLRVSVPNACNSDTLR